MDCAAVLFNCIMIAQKTYPNLQAVNAVGMWKACDLVGVHRSLKLESWTPFFLGQIRKMRQVPETRSSRKWLALLWNACAFVVCVNRVCASCTVMDCKQFHICVYQSKENISWRSNAWPWLAWLAGSTSVAWLQVRNNQFFPTVDPKGPQLILGPQKGFASWVRGLDYLRFGSAGMHHLCFFWPIVRWYQLFWSSIAFLNHAIWFKFWIWLWCFQLQGPMLFCAEQAFCARKIERKKTHGLCSLRCNHAWCLVCYILGTAASDVSPWPWEWRLLSMNLQYPWLGYESQKQLVTNAVGSW